MVHPSPLATGGGGDETDRQTDRQRQTETDRQTDRDRQRDRDTHTEYFAISLSDVKCVTLIPFVG